MRRAGEGRALGWSIEIPFDTVSKCQYSYVRPVDRSHMISKTCEYALRAMVYLAQHVDDWPVAGRRIAEDADVPRKYLSAILGDLVRSRVLDSSPGVGGGFRMVRPPDSIMLSEVFAPFEPILANRRPCPFGNETCSDEDPCGGHEEWKHVRETYTSFLEKTSVFDVAFPRRPRRGSGRRRKKRR